MKLRKLHTLVLAGMICLLVLGARPENRQASAAAIVPEGNDFATRVLADPWDMSEYSDVSQYMNSDDTQFNVTNINVADGIFSATSVAKTDPDAQFFVLFPGYGPVLPVGKVGAVYPIEAQTYKCLYFAMKADTQPIDSKGYDTHQVFWFSDTGPSYNSLGTYMEVTDWSKGTPQQIWRLYTMDLSKSYSGGLRWDSQAAWKGLRIDPTNRGGENFAVDWVRLTDCAPRTHTVSWNTPVSGGSIWARPQGSARNIRIAPDASKINAKPVAVDGTSYTLDLQGMQPGTYELFISATPDTCCGASLGTVQVNQAPIVQISRPSFTSGASYGDQIGNPWDMSDSQDAYTKCTNSYFQNGMLVMDTPTATEQPPECIGGWVADPKIYLNSPQDASTADYRYLTFRMKTDGAWQKFGGGMMARFVWRTNTCDLVSNDIVFDVGWNTLSIDLHGVAGDAVQYAPPSPSVCDTVQKSWTGNALANNLRFDPNENVSGATFHQEMDWITLNKMDAVKSGQYFPLGVSTNKDPGAVTLTYYYTSDLANPKQNRAVIVDPGSGTPPQPLPGPKLLFLPGIFNAYDPSAQDGGTQWDTRGVAAGTYYICVEADDSLNSAVYCSEAPVSVSK